MELKLYNLDITFIKDVHEIIISNILFPTLILKLDYFATRYYVYVCDNFQMSKGISAHFIKSKRAHFYKTRLECIITHYYE